MSLFHVTFTKEISVMVEANSQEECEKAAEEEANSHNLQYYDGEDWTYFVYDVRTRAGFIPPEPDTGIGLNGLMTNIFDARREKRTHNLMTAGIVKCPWCNHTDESTAFVEVLTEHENAVTYCPECQASIDAEDILDGTIVTKSLVLTKDTRTLNLFSENEKEIEDV